MALGQVAVVNKLLGPARRAKHAGELIERQLKLGIADDMVFKKRVAHRVKQATVEGGDLERRAARIDNPEEVAQLGPGAPGISKQRDPAVETAGGLAHHRVEAVLIAVGRALAQGQQLAGLGVQDKQQAVEDDQAARVDVAQRSRRRIQLIMGDCEEALGEMAQRIKDLGLEALADATGVIHALAQHPIERQQIVNRRRKRRAAKESVEIEERRRLSGLNQILEVNLVEAILALDAVLMIEPPAPPIGQDAPGRPRVAHIKRNLVSGHTGQILVLAGGGNIELALPVLRITDGQRARQIRVGEHLALIGIERRRIRVEKIIRLLGALRRSQRRLHLKGMTERLQHRAHQIALGLGLIGGRGEGGENRLDAGEYRGGFGDEREPRLAAGNGLIEVAVGEELAVMVALGQGKGKLRD